MSGSVLWTFTGLRLLYIEDEEIDLGGGFSLMKVNDSIRCGWDHYFMSKENYEEAEASGSYLVFKRTQDFLTTEDVVNDSQQLQNGLAAFQIIKPTHTIGFIFHCEQLNGPLLSLKTAEHRPPITPGQWARMREFDSDLRELVPSMISRVRNTMSGTNVEHKNSIILFQLALEHMHPLIAGLLHIMGMEAIFDSNNRHDFKNKLCDCLGGLTLAFPDWNSPTMSQPRYTVDELAIPIYMFRNKLAHGSDLRKAGVDKNTPVDLIKKVELIPELEPRAHAYLLAEVACYLHCQVLQKVL